MYNRGLIAAAGFQSVVLSTGFFASCMFVRFLHVVFACFEEAYTMQRVETYRSSERTERLSTFWCLDHDLTDTAVQKDSYLTCISPLPRVTVLKRHVSAHHSQHLRCMKAYNSSQASIIA
jgi:hypothetical protein